MAQMTKQNPITKDIQKKKKTNRVSMENQINKEIRNMIIKTKLVKIVNIK